MEGKTLYLFVDESGNLDFSGGGSKYYFLSCFSTLSPVEGREKLLALKYELLNEGRDQEVFHASEDKQFVRDKVFNIAKDIAEDIEIHSVVAQKNKVNPSLRGEALYELLSRTLLQYVFRRPDIKKINKIIIVLSSNFTKKKRSLILKTLKKYLKGKFTIPFEIYFHSNNCDLNCQLADYFCWAIAIKWERGEERSYQIISDKIKSEFDIFTPGSTLYY